MSVKQVTKYGPGNVIPHAYTVYEHKSEWTAEDARRAYNRNPHHYNTVFILFILFAMVFGAVHLMHYIAGQMPMGMTIGNLVGVSLFLLGLAAAPVVLFFGTPRGAIGTLLRLVTALEMVFVYVPAMIVAAAVLAPAWMTNAVMAQGGKPDTMTYVVIIGSYLLLSLLSVMRIYRRR